MGMSLEHGVERRTGIVTNRDERLAMLYTTHATAATRLAYLLTGDAHTAEDVMQEAFVRVGARLPLLHEPERAAGYLLRTVGNLAKDRARKLKLERERPLPGHEPSVPGAGESVRQDVLAALMRLPQRQRTAVFLRYYLDMTEQHAAQTLGCSTAAMKSLTNRAMVSLRATLEGGRE